MWCKHTNYEQAARIPIIVAAPGAARGAVTAALIETVDLYPTLCELAGLPVPGEIDGRSFAGVIRQPDSQVRSHVSHVYPRSDRLGRAIRDERYRMVEWKVPGAPAATAEIELYDYHSDPLETKNIAATAPGIVAELLAALAAQPEAKRQWKPSKRE
jgi:iduronate 2-sulfatase